MGVLSAEVLECGQPLRIGVPVLSAYGPVTDVDLPTLILQVEFTRRRDVVGGEQVGAEAYLTTYAPSAYQGFRWRNAGYLMPGGLAGDEAARRYAPRPARKPAPGPPLRQLRRPPSPPAPTPSTTRASRPAPRSRPPTPS
jgi:hypothetical protein